MTKILYVNNYTSTINGAINNSTTTIIVTSATGLPTITGSDYYYLTLSGGGVYEIVKVTARTGTTLTVTRGQDGTTGVSWTDGSVISMRAIAANYKNPVVETLSSDTSVTVGGNSTAAGYIDLLEDSDNGSNKVRITAPSSIASDKTITLQDITGTVYITGGTDVAVADGGTGVSSVTTAPTASSFAGWDSNSNLSANNFLTGYTSTATAAGTTTLTVASTQNQIFTGSTTQNCDLPVVSTLALGTLYRIVNLSSGVVTVRSSGSNTVQAMQANSTLVVVSNATSGTSAAVWHVIDYTTAASGQTGSGSLVRATSPTLTTPTLGVAAATSINFGQDALNYYDEGSWTPVFTFETLGNLSVVYTTQIGSYTRVGNYCIINCSLTCTPTFTTSSGRVEITGLPFTSAAAHSGSINSVSSGVTWPAGGTTIVPQTNGAVVRVLFYGSATAAQSLTTTGLVSGAQITLNFNVYYRV